MNPPQYLKRKSPHRNGPQTLMEKNTWAVFKI